jgi:hypothetical protein
VILAAALALLAPIPSDVELAPWFVERGVSVSIDRRKEGAPWVCGAAELPVGAETVFGILLDYAGYEALMAPAVKKATVLEQEGPRARLHFVWRYPFPFRNRDGIVAYAGRRLADGAYAVSWRDDARPGDPAEGVRISRIAGESRIERLGPDRCRVTYIYLGDLGGRFPKTLEEKAWRHEPLGYMYALRRRLGLPIPPP